MRYFVTGASGWIGSAVTAELLSAGHEVRGLARSDASAARIEAAGATAVRGELTDLDTLRAAAADSDGVVHLGFVHDFANYAESGRIERAAVTAFGEVLAGSDRPLLLAAGVAGLATDGQPATEDARSPFSGPDAPRGDGEGLVLDLATRGVRGISARFAPTVHGQGDHGFIAFLAGVAKQAGFSAYIGDGAGRWAAVAREDAARLVARAVVDAPAGTVLHAVGEEGIRTREIAELIGTGLGVPTRSISAEQADEHFTWMARFFGSDLPASSARTRAERDWTPTGPTLAEDLAPGSAYFA